MSDDGDIDVESAEDVPDIGGEATATTTNGTIYSRGNSHDKRAHHNALERRRRDHIKDSFHGLRDCIPSLVGEKVSRAHILNKATEYIRHMQKGGSTREDDICDLARKNEILEEQVRSLEEAKVEGVPVNTEELLQSVANRVQARQAQEVLQQLQAKNNVKTSKQQGSNKGQSKTTPSSASSDKTSTKSPPTATCADTPSTNTPTSSSSHSSQLLPPNFNILASNLKSTQSLLSVLQKNLSPNSNLPSNIKSLAARVLASPLVRAQKTSQVTSLPRGIVTATTVPKGNNTSPSVSLSKSPVKVTGITTNTTTMSSDNADSAQISTPTVTDTTDSTTDVGGNIQEDTTAIQTPEGDDESDAQAPAQHIQTDVPAVVPNPPAPLSVGQTSPTFLTSQLLEVHNHLQQQGAGFTSNLPSGPDYGGVQGLNQELDSSSSIAASTLNTAAQSLNITPELLAQVSSFLNLPPLSSTAGTSPSSGPSLIPQDTFPQELPQTVPTTTPISVKRPASSSEHDALSTKKPHLDL